MKKENIIKNFTNNLLVKNTLILFSTNIFIKLLSMVNRIIITRMLGEEGIGLYVLILPTIMLLCSVSSFSLTLTVTRLAAENEVTKKYEDREIITSALIIGLKATIITIIIFMFTYKIIALDLLKQEKTVIPLFFAILMIPFAMINSIFKGFLNGKNKIKETSLSTLIEQIFRMIFAFTMLLLTKDYGIVVSVTITIIAMAVGEFASFIFYLFKMNKIKLSKKANKPLTKEIFLISSKQTLSHITTSIAFFLEPIIFTNILLLQKYNAEEIAYRYSEVNAFALPLLTMFMMFSNSLATVIIPKLSDNTKQEDNKKLFKYALNLTLLPGIFASVLFFFYGDNYLQFLYNTQTGSYYVKKYSFIYMIFYIQPILLAMMYANKLEGRVLLYTIISTSIKIMILYFIPKLTTCNYEILMQAIVLSELIKILLYFITIQKRIKIHYNKEKFVKLAFLFMSYFYIVYLLKHFNINYVLSSFISLFIFICLITIFKITSFHNE